MKNTLKLIAAALAAVTALSCTSATAFADKLTTVDGVTYRYSDSGEQLETYSGFTSSETGRRYYKNGIVVKNKWLKTASGKRYYAGSNGILYSGGHKFSNGWHWFSEKGIEAAGNKTLFGVNYSFSKKGIWNGVDGKTLTSIFNVLNETMPEDIYGGVYFDNDSGMITVYSADIGKMKEAVPKLYPEMEIRECTYTYAQLEATAKALNDNSSKFPEAHLNVSIDVQHNWVETGTDNISDDLRGFIDALEFGGCVHLTGDELSLDAE